MSKSQRWRKKPTVVNVFQMTREARLDTATWPKWLLDAWMKPHDEVGGLQPSSDDPRVLSLHIVTLEGKMLVVTDAWIVQGVAGELHPVRDDIFRATYQKVDDDE